MISHGSTVVAAIAQLKAWGVQKIVVVSALVSRHGLEILQAAHPDVVIHVAQVDDKVSVNGMILPGCGDAGDRQFGTPSYGTHPMPVSPCARKRVTAHEQHPKTLVLGEVVSTEDVGEVVDPEPEDDSCTALTTHVGTNVAPIKMQWGAPTPGMRGPVIATVRHQSQRNALGAHGGGYSIYRALAVVQGSLDKDYMPNLDLTTAVAKIGPFETWKDPKKIVTIDPWGHAIAEGFEPWLNRGYDIRPTIAVTKAHVELPECKEALQCGRLTPDGLVLTSDGQSFVTKAAIEPVWYLPGIAERFGATETVLREALFKETNSMYPELLTRQDVKVFLPPIGGLTVYIWGDPELIPDNSVELTVRVHDECNGSDVFGSDICTCRPYLTHAIEECIKSAQKGGTGVCVYFRKEGRALGEVTKYLVYNMRKRQEGGDRAAEYFKCTQSVAGVTDTRFQALMPDVLHWLGITHIHKFISMSDMKHDAIVASGITIGQRVEIPPEMVPKDAQVEIAAKVFAGYHSGNSYKAATSEDTLNQVKGREYTEHMDYHSSVQEGGGAIGAASGST